MGASGKSAEKAAQVCAAVQEQDCYSKQPSVFLLMGGNMCGKHVRTPVPVKSAPDLPCSRAHKATDP